MALEVRPAAISIADRGGRIGAAFYLLFVIMLVYVEGPGGGQVHGSAAVIYLAILAPVSIGLLSRVWLMGTRFDDHGIRVRKYFSTRRFGWPEVSHFADGGWMNDADDQRWVLDIVLHDGRTVTTGATSSGKTARPGQLAAIRRAAARYHIPADLTGEAVTEERPVGLYPDPGGQPGLRRWEGSEWSPWLRPDPGRGAPAGKPAPAEVWSPLPGTEEQWHGAGSQARRAGAWSAAIFALAVIILAWAGLLAWRDGTGGSFGIVFSVGVFVLNAALASLGMVLYYRKIARASQAAAGNAGTGEQPGLPTR